MDDISTFTWLIDAFRSSPLPTFITLLVILIAWLIRVNARNEARAAEMHKTIMEQTKESNKATEDARKDFIDELEKKRKENREELNMTHNAYRQEIAKLHEEYREDIKAEHQEYRNDIAEMQRDMKENNIQFVEALNNVSSQVSELNIRVSRIEECIEVPVEATQTK